VRWAEYAVLDVGDGRRRIELRRVPLDLAALRAALRDSGMPEAGWWLGKWADAPD
jgi:hypothetical protein